MAGLLEVGITVDLVQITIAYILGMLTVVGIILIYKHFQMRDQLKEVKKSK